MLRWTEFNGVCLSSGATAVTRVQTEFKVRFNQSLQLEIGLSRKLTREVRCVKRVDLQCSDGRFEVDHRNRA